MMFDHILVPLDGSSLSECALPHAIAMGLALDARVTLLRVAERDRDPAIRRAIDPVEWQLYAAEAYLYLEEAAQELEMHGLQVEARLLEGDPAERIVQFAASHEVDLVVISTHGQSGPSGWNIGSVVQKVILKTPTPVMIVRAYTDGSWQLTPAKYDRVLVPLDGSRRAECVLPVATSLPRGDRSTLLLAHVVNRPEMVRTRPATLEETALIDRMAEANRRAAETYLDHLQRNLAQTAETRVLVSDDAAAMLHQLVEEESIDLVVLCAHGYTGDSHWPYGSLALNFIVYGATPLLIVQDISLYALEPTRAEEAATQRKGH
jgi:nucleotide-binding universal stress UspA family protein